MIVKKTLFVNFQLNLSIYTIVYLIKTFIIWKFTNPFLWIINIPSYPNEIRAGIIFSILIWQSFQIGILYDFFRVKSYKEIK